MITFDCFVLMQIFRDLLLSGIPLGVAFQFLDCHACRLLQRVRDSTVFSTVFFHCVLLGTDYIMKQICLAKAAYQFDESYASRDRNALWGSLQKKWHGDRVNLQVGSHFLFDCLK